MKKHYIMFYYYIPGDQHSSVHWWDVISSTGNVVGAEVPRPPKLLILPMAEALQRPFSMMAHLQLFLKNRHRAD